jgi:hypothetical protein
MVRDVIARSEATKQSRSAGREPDCFASLAMTGPAGVPVREIWDKRTVKACDEERALFRKAMGL